MGIVKLGRNVLRWCRHCNVPILESERCTSCGQSTEEVRITPPGDARPAFEWDRQRIISLADRQFGEGTGALLVPEDRVVILSRCPSLDRMDEIVADGEVLGTIIFDPPRGERLLIRPVAARRMIPKMSRGKVVADPGAFESISRGCNLMGPGVVRADPDISSGDEVAVVTDDGHVLGTGAARKSTDEMAERGRGVAVKIRWKCDALGSHEELEPSPNSWDKIVEANRECIERRVEKAKKFIRELTKKFEKPLAVSFSGGKDSLVSLHLAIEAGLRPAILFADTGLEFEETVEEVRRVAEEAGLPLLVESAGEGFWRDVEVFGPPGKDFRWCCKTCKLGPTTRLISKHFPDGVISLIGQRSYESEQRMRKGSIWRNPWVPGQIGASPIQRWNAMHIWLYIFSRGLRFNPWYERGLDRIGCFMCPSSDIAELEIVRNGSAKYSRWKRYLHTYREQRGLPAHWESLALWRWKILPPAMRDRMRQLGVELETMPRKQDADGVVIRLKMAKGYRPCTTGGFSSEGVFLGSIEMERVANLLNIIGPVEYIESEGLIRTTNVVLFAEGAVTIKGKNETRIEQLARRLEELVMRAMYCVGCGVCIGRCERGAISVDERVEIDPKRCTHCSECLGPCPVLRFDSEMEV